MDTARVTRRGFMLGAAADSIGGALVGLEGSRALPADAAADWLALRHDPVRESIQGRPRLDQILAMFPRVTGKPAFDPGEIADHAARLSTTPDVKTGHPHLDRCVKVGLAHIDVTFHGDHPKYGVGVYARPEHDGFPPTIIAAVDALSAWGLCARAAQLYQYWLSNFVRDDGTITYYGPSISEYGQLLHTAALLRQRAVADTQWWQASFKALDRMVEHLLGLHAAAVKQKRLISGVPEADTRRDVAQYFHNNAWIVKGLRRWAQACQRSGATPTTTVATVRKVAGQMAEATLQAIARTWPIDPNDWWLSPQVEPVERPRCATGGRVASYTNYRYWPELLSSDLLPRPLAERVVRARLTAGGQFCGMTRFADHLDDWPLAEYLFGLWRLGRRDDFLLSLYGHVAYHQAEKHLTAYEQVAFPPGRPVADYCLPCQLVAPRAARLLIRG